MSSFPALQPVNIPYSDIKDRSADLSEKIERGFGPDGLGIITVSDVPGYTLLRQNLLHLAPRLAGLSEETKKELEDPGSRYNFGWSHGKEKLESGKPGLVYACKRRMERTRRNFCEHVLVGELRVDLLDMLKGSYYANPILDVPTTEEQLIMRYPSYCGSNIWPKKALPELELAFKDLGKLILDVGLMVAHHCDQYVAKGRSSPNTVGFEHTLSRSRCHKGRLLYYFPSEESDCTQKGEDIVSSWCGWHTDHGSLTGLTRAIFTKDAIEVPCPDSAAGLYIRTRTNQIVKVVYDEDQIAYQIGETSEILSRGFLCATPHCVQAPCAAVAKGVDRSTFALFMQPDWDEKLNFPEDVHIHKELISSRSLTFGEYSELLLDKYYHQRT